MINNLEERLNKIPIPEKSSSYEYTMLYDLAHEMFDEITALRKLADEATPGRGKPSVVIEGELEKDPNG